MTAEVVFNKDVEVYYQYMCLAVDRIFASLEGLSHEQMNWRPIPGETNSIFVLCTHIMGNFRQTILATLCGEPDNRDRDAEFQARVEDELQLHWVERDGKLVEEWESHPIQEEWVELKEELKVAMAELSPEDLDREYDHPRRGRMTGWEVLLVAATHANEHTGHAELTRQLIDAKIEGLS